MRPAVALVIGLAMSATVYGAVDAPSDQVLAQMGLANMQVMSDDDAMVVRGMGFDGFRELHHGIRDFHKQVKAFHREVKDFHKEVKKFHRKMDKGHQPKKNHMKTPKMRHGKPNGMPKGGKVW
jgi:hypothetical protein